MSNSTWMLVILISVVVVSAAIFYAVVINGGEDEEGDSSQQNLREEGNLPFSIDTVDFSEAPPKPVFNSQDNADCRKDVKEHYETASSTYER